LKKQKIGTMGIFRFSRSGHDKSSSENIYSLSLLYHRKFCENPNRFIGFSKDSF
jgi:hypothetical protein